MRRPKPRYGRSSVSSYVTGRITPYEKVFGAERFAQSDFPAIAEEARRSGRRTERVEEFGLLPRVGILLQELAAPEAGAAALEFYLAALFHAFHFWRAGCPVYAFEESVIRLLVEAELNLEGWVPRAPHEAAYLELPHGLFWLSVAEDAPPEPAEGIFTRLDRGEQAEIAGAVDLLLVLGMRLDRPGFSAVPLQAELEEPQDEGGESLFRSEIPGAEAAGLYSLQRPAELLLLIRRALWYLDRFGEASERVEGGGGAEGATGLAYYRVSLAEGA